MSFSNDHARLAWEAFLSGKQWLATTTHKRAPRHSVEAKLRARDGDGCFFCAGPFTEDKPATLEHLLSIAHGGNNHLSNLALAHGDCNMRAGNLSVIEKVRLREAMRGGEARLTSGEHPDFSIGVGELLATLLSADSAIANRGKKTTMDWYTDLAQARVEIAPLLARLDGRS